MKLSSQGMPKEVSREKLIEILTVFIFTSSVQHAAVNFGQYDEYAFPPNYPADLHGSRPTSRVSHRFSIKFHLLLYYSKYLLEPSWISH